MLKTMILLIAFCLPGLAQSHQLALTGGYNYQDTDQGHGLRTNLNGWFASAEFDLSNTVSITAEMDNYYGSVGSKNTAQENFVIGPQLTFRSDKATLWPFVYVQGGDQRSAFGSDVEHAFNFQLGGGVQLKLNDRVSLELTPAEYSLATPNGIATHSYSAKAGISWTIWKQTRFPQ
jgi:outer membrane protein with beta-barrel domain